MFLRICLVSNCFFPYSSQFTDPSTCTISVTSPASFEGSKGSVSSCTLYHDKGPEPWLRKTSTDAWLSTGVGEAIDGTDGAVQDHGDVYCVVCYENGNLEIFDVPNFSCVFSVENFLSGKSHLVDALTKEAPKDSQKGDKVSDGVVSQGRKDALNMKVVELVMQRWSGKRNTTLFPAKDSFIFWIKTPPAKLIISCCRFRRKSQKESLCARQFTGTCWSDRLLRIRCPKRIRQRLPKA